MPPQAGSALEAPPTRRAAEVTQHPVVNPLVVVKDAGQAEGLAAREAHKLFLLRVDACVVAQSHGVGEGLGAEGAAEVARLVGVFVVQQRASMAVAAATNVASKRPFFLDGVGLWLGFPAVWVSIACVG